MGERAELHRAVALRRAAREIADTDELRAVLLLVADVLERGDAVPLEVMGRLNREIDLMRSRLPSGGCCLAV